MIMVYYPNMNQQFPQCHVFENNGDYKKYQFSSQSKRELDYHKVEKFLDSVDQDNGTWEKLKKV